MKIGLSVPLAHETPQQWAKKHRELGCGSVVFPVNCEASPETIDAYRQAAEQEGLIIAEVGIWKNVLAVDNREREEAVAYSINQLKMADEIGAKCCVNIVGTPHGPIWDGGYPGNFSKETWKMAVDSIQHIIDEANPVNTKFSIEPMPWMIPTGPDEYLRLIGDVDREAFGVHMDLINMVNCPQRYFFAEEFMEECFSKLKGRILSCHIKDVLLLNEFTFQLRECACGEGTLPLEKYAQLSTAENPDMPMIIEHLHSDEEYLQSLSYLQKRLKTDSCC